MPDLYYPADETLTGLRNGHHGDSGLLFGHTGDWPHFLSLAKREWFLDRILQALNSAWLYRAAADGALQCSVLPICVENPATGQVLFFAGATGQTLTDDATNFLYLTISTGAVALGLNTTGFPMPTPSAPVLWLGTILTAAGAYTWDDVTDYRAASMFRFSLGSAVQAFFAATDMTGAEAETLTDGSIADALHTHDTDGLEDEAVTAGKLAATLDLSGKAVTVAAPSASGHPTTKQYVDNLAAGLKAKQSVKAASTGNLTLSGEQTIDGISCVADDRVLVKSQTAPAENGLYVVASGAWTRATDADAWAELVSAHVMVDQGTANGDVSFVCTVNAGGTLETTDVTWEKFSKVSKIQVSDITDLTATAAQLNEAGAFFGGTDITAAEAETLTDGSNANLLHTHDVVCVGNEPVCWENDLVFA